MRFSSGTNMLSILIHDYQFPHLDGTNSIAGFDYDANWLNMMLTLKEEHSTFVQIDPFLMTTEVQDLITWLNALPAPPVKTIGFTEPSFEIEFLGERSGTYDVRITLCLELLPPWAGDTAVHTVTFSLSPNEVKEGAQSLHKQLQQYPTRP